MRVRFRIDRSQRELFPVESGIEFGKLFDWRLGIDQTSHVINRNSGASNDGRSLQNLRVFHDHLAGLFEFLEATIHVLPNVGPRDPN